MLKNNFKKYTEYCDALDKCGMLRCMSTVKKNCFNTENIIDFSSNDYLWLSKNNKVIEAGVAAAHMYGAGSTGSRLLSGNCAIFEQFEHIIAHDKHFETALIFPTGYQANLGVLSALCNAKVLGHHPMVFFDKLNHASLYHAVFLSQAELIRYQHLNMEFLENSLQKYKHDKRTKIIVSETVFGMDGDSVNVKQIQEIAHKYNAILMLDDAHATGILGKKGLGLSTFTKDNNNLVVTATFSKALGVAGGYVACSHDLKKYFMQMSGSFIYSTAQSPFVIGAAMSAWKISKTMDHIRCTILNHADIIRKELFDIISNNHCTHIVSIIFDCVEKMQNAKMFLSNNNVNVSAIRPPTSPTSRLRIAINANHSIDDVYFLVELLKQYKKHVM